MHDSIFDTPFVRLSYHAPGRPADKFLRPFYQRLNDPDLEGHAPLDHKERARRRRDLCDQTISSLLEQDSEADSLTRLALMAARATIRTHLADSLRSLDEYDLAYDTLSEAILEARRSKDDQAQYYTLHSLGVHHSNSGDHKAAAYWFMRSMMYAHAYWPYNLRMTLHWLAATLERMPEGLPQALLIQDWHSLLWPADIGAMVKSFELRIASGQRDQVSECAGCTPGESPRWAARVLAARLALGLNEQAKQAAEVGLELAEAEGDYQLILAFSHQLGHDPAAAIERYTERWGQPESVGET